MLHSLRAGGWVPLIVSICGLGAIGRAARAEQDVPDISKLPEVRDLPNPFHMNSGSEVKTREDWDQRRAELRELILRYEYGTIPTDPVEVKASQVRSSEDPETHATVRELTLTMAPGAKVSTPLILTIPPGKGPFPVIIKGDMTWGRVKPEIVREVIGRGYVLAEFDRTAIAPDKDDRTTGVFPLYPDHTWGDLAAWAWGYSRVIDYLVVRDDIDRTKIIATGHSRGGKATLLAGALDDRIALTVPNGSGAGGAGCFRVQWPMSEDLKAVTGHFPYWFAPHFGDFVGHVDQLPFDQHELRALVAPRALLTTDSLDDLWANPLGTQMSYLAAREVFDFLGVPQKTGLHYRHGPHDQNLEDFTALLDFADGQLQGKTPAGKFDVLPFPDFPPAFKWAAPKGAK